MKKSLAISRTDNCYHRGFVGGKCWVCRHPAFDDKKPFVAFCNNSAFPEYCPLTSIEEE